LEQPVSGGGSFGFLRLFRIARIFKIANKGYEMQQLLGTFVESFKAGDCGFCCCQQFLVVLEALV
jgi:hypothetical protein